MNKRMTECGWKWYDNTNGALKSGGRRLEVAESFK